MRIVRHKTLSQFVDLENIYKNMTLLSDLFMFTNDYFLFMKKKTNNEVWITKESFSGDFEIFKVPFQTQGIQITEQTLLKHYNFKDINVTILCFKVNSIHYFTFIEDEEGQSAIYIDTTDNSSAMNFINSSCPFLTTYEDENYSIYSFNNSHDGTNSSILYNTNIDWTNYNDTTYQSLESILTKLTLTATSFNFLITENNYRLQNYSMSNNVPTVYIKNLTTLQSMLFNQTISGQSQVYTLDLSSLQYYIGKDITNSMVLVSFNNNSLIYFNTDISQYTYKNLFAYYMNGFDSTQIFDIPQTRFNLAKELIRNFVEDYDLTNYKIGKVYNSSNIFMQIESNIETNSSSIYKSLTTYFEDVDPTLDSILLSDEKVNSSIFLQSYCKNEKYQYDLQKDNFTDVNLNNRYWGVLQQLTCENEKFISYDGGGDEILITPKLNEINLSEETLEINFKYSFSNNNSNTSLSIYLLNDTISNGMTKSDFITNGLIGYINLSAYQDTDNLFFANEMNCPRIANVDYAVKILLSSTKQIIYIDNILYKAVTTDISTHVQYIGISNYNTQISKLLISKKKMSLNNIKASSSETWKIDLIVSYDMDSIVDGQLLDGGKRGYNGTVCGSPKVVSDSGSSCIDFSSSTLTNYISVPSGICAKNCSSSSYQPQYYIISQQSKITSVVSSSVIQSSGTENSYYYGSYTTGDGYQHRYYQQSYDFYVLKYTATNKIAFYYLSYLYRNGSIYNYGITLKQPMITITPNQQNHFFFVADGECTKVYINNVLAFSGYYGYTIGGENKFYIGYCPCGTDSPFKGKMKKFKVWNRVLTSNEMSAIYEL